MGRKKWLVVVYRELSKRDGFVITPYFLAWAVSVPSSRESARSRLAWWSWTIFSLTVDVLPA
jgi:hypothetical protein